MKLKQVHYNNILEHVGYAGGRSRNRKNTNYPDVGTKIKNMGHTPPFEHYHITFDLDGTSRFILYLLSTSRVLTLTANSQRYLEVLDILDSYKQDPFVSKCLHAYKEARKINIKKEVARSLLPLASKTADASFTADIRELNRLYKFFIDQKTPESLELASKIGNYLKTNNVLFDEPLPSGYYPCITYPSRKDKPKIGNITVIPLEAGGIFNQFYLEIPFYVWMQLIRHKSLSFTDVKVLNSFESIVLDHLDCLNLREINNPYHILNGQFISVLVGGPVHAWQNFLRWRLEKATQPTTQQLAQLIAQEIQ